MDPIEGIAAILGLIYLVLAIRERRECWIPGGLASLLFLGVFWQAGLPMQALLQVYYVAIAIHGWWYWGNSSKAKQRPITRLGMHQQLSILMLWLILSLGTQFLRDGLLDPLAWSDTLTSWGGVLATWMVARKILQAWTYWVIVDAATVALYLQAGLLASSALYGVYTLLAVIAWQQWHKSFQSPSHEW